MEFESNSTQSLETKYKPLVVILSVVIPVVIALLFKVRIEGYDLKFLPPVYATVNALTAILLVAALWALKSGSRKRHQMLMTTAVAFSVIFLVLYVLYHLTSESTVFGDLNHDGERDAAEGKLVGTLLYVYTFVLLTHILLSMVVLPLVMMTYLKGWAGNVNSHRKWARITFPIWLYVAMSGVVVFLMIRPYYL